MIFVTLGTQDKSFKRLLKDVDKEIEKGNIKEKVIVQRGFTKYKSKNMEMFDLKNPEEIDELIRKASIVITHGGVGSIIGSLKYDKPVIAAPRLSKYKEHTNDHQKEIVNEFEKEGYLIAYNEGDDLGEKIKIAKKFKPKKYKSNNKKFVKLIDDYIKKTDSKSFVNKYLYIYIIILIIIVILIIF